MPRVRSKYNPLVKILRTPLKVHLLSDSYVSFHPLGSTCLSSACCSLVAINSVVHLKSVSVG